MRPTISGGVVAAIDATTIGSSTYNKRLVAFDRHGNIVWEKTYGSAGRDLPINWVTHAVDLNGNIAVQQAIEIGKTIGGSYYKFGEIRIELLSGATGELLVSRTLRGNSATAAGPSYGWSNPVSAGKNTAYVIATQCSTSSYCNLGSTKIYPVVVPGLEMDYPRGAILRASEPWKNLAVLGDSFSSGEGAGSYDPATDVGGDCPNRCHRSNNAYAKLLHNNPQARLKLSAFVACSGAETRHLTEKWVAVEGEKPKNRSELPQVAVLDQTTDRVAITIGGNDSRFKEFVIQCLFLDCSNDVNNRQFFDVIANLGAS